MNIKDKQWIEAEEHLKYVENMYKKIITMQNVNPYFGLGVIAATKRRYENGERTEQLYKDIMSLE